MFPSMASNQASTNSQMNNDQSLDWINDAIILATDTDQTTKGIFTHFLHAILRKLDFHTAPRLEDFPVYDEWRELSEHFYELAGVQGKVVGSWTMEERINGLGQWLRGVDNNEEEMEEVDIDEFLAQLRREGQGREGYGRR